MPLDRSLVGQEIDRSKYPALAVTLDEPFDQLSLDTNLWIRELPWGPSININGELQFYDNGTLNSGSLEMTGTHVNLRAIETPSSLQGLAVASGQQKPYISTVLSTWDNFAQEYGLFECEVLLPGNPGTSDSDGAFAAFWREEYYADKYGGHNILPEDDTFEWLGNQPSELHYSQHENPSKSQIITTSRQDLLQIDPRGSWHKFTEIWEPDTCKYALNDVIRAEVPTPISWSGPQFLILNLAIGGVSTFGGKVSQTANSVFPMAMGVRNLKVYSRSVEPGSRFRVPGGRRMAERLGQTTAGMTIGAELPDTHQQAEHVRSVGPIGEVIRMPYLDDNDNEVEWTDNSVMQNNSNNTAGIIKDVVYSMNSNPSALIHAHRNCRITLADFTDGMEYTLTLSRVKHAQVTVEIVHPNLKLPKETLPEINDSAWLINVLTYRVSGDFIFLTDVRNY